MANLESWIIEQGLRGSNMTALLSGFAEGLMAEGLPLMILMPGVIYGPGDTSGMHTALVDLERLLERLESGR